MPTSSWTGSGPRSSRASSRSGPSSPSGARASAPSTGSCASCSGSTPRWRSTATAPHFVRAVVDKVGMDDFNAVWAKRRQPAVPGRDPRSGQLGRTRARMSLHPSLAAVRHAVRRGLADLEPGARLLVACSGGADSLALASATVFEGREQGWYVVGVTVDHGLQEDSAERAERVVAQLAGLGRRRDRQRPRDGRRAGTRARGGRPGGALRPARGGPRAVRGGGGAARSHPRRPGGDRPDGPRPRLGRPGDRRDASLVRPLPPSPARRLAHRHRHRLPGRGARGVGGPAQRRRRLHPRARPAPGAPACSRTSSAPASPSRSRAPPTTSAPTWSSSTRTPTLALADVVVDGGLSVEAMTGSCRLRSAHACCATPLVAAGAPAGRDLPPARRRRRRPRHRLARPEVGRPARPRARRTPRRGARVRARAPTRPSREPLV